jgi:hypothetical protein
MLGFLQTAAENTFRRLYQRNKIHAKIHWFDRVERRREENRRKSITDRPIYAKRLLSGIHTLLK